MNDIQKLPSTYRPFFRRAQYLSCFYGCLLISPAIGLPLLLYFSDFTVPIPILVFLGFFFLLLVVLAYFLFDNANALGKDASALQVSVRVGTFEKRSLERNSMAVYNYFFKEKDSVKGNQGIRIRKHSWNNKLFDLPKEVEIWQGKHSGMLAKIVLSEIGETLDLIKN